MACKMIGVNERKYDSEISGMDYVYQQMHHIQRETRKYRMTYERAGLLFRAMNYQPDACAQVSVQDIVDMGLTLPDNLGRFPFAEFVDENADRLQLFDEHPTIQIKYENPTTYICLYLNELDK